MGRGSAAGWQMDNSAAIQLLYIPDNHYYYSVYLCPEAIKQLHGTETQSTGFLKLRKETNDEKAARRDKMWGSIEIMKY